MQAGLNIAEIEINVMDTESIGRRIGDKNTLINENQAWMERRNKNRSKIDWRFTKKMQITNYQNIM